MATKKVPTVTPQATDIAKFNVGDLVIEKFKADYMGLTIKDITDDAGLKAVHAARMNVKSTRVSVEKRLKEIRKDLKSRIEEELLSVDTEAKRLLALLEPIETYLETQEKAIDEEKDRIKNAAKYEAERVAKYNAEVDEAYIENTRIENEKERAKLDAEKAEVARKQAEIDKKEAVEKAKVESLRSTRHLALVSIGYCLPDGLDLGLMDESTYSVTYLNQKAEYDRLREAERVEKESIAREKAQIAEKEGLEAQRIERERLESAKPDVDKLLQFADTILAMEIPAMTTPEGLKLSLDAREMRASLCDHIYDECAKIKPSLPIEQEVAASLQEIMDEPW